eukprot:s1605_g15.t1
MAISFKEELTDGWAVFAARLEQPPCVGTGTWGTGAVLVLLCSGGWWKSAAFLFLLLLRGNLFGKVIEEKVVCTKGLGLQLTSRSAWVTPWGEALVCTSSDFIETADIEEIIIAEAVTYWDVFYYIVVELHGCDRSKVPFRQLRPREVPQLIRVLKVLRQMLLQDTSCLEDAADMQRPKRNARPKIWATRETTKHATTAGPVPGPCVAETWLVYTPTAPLRW